MGQTNPAHSKIVRGEKVFTCVKGVFMVENNSQGCANHFVFRGGWKVEFEQLQSRYVCNTPVILISLFYCYNLIGAVKYFLEGCVEQTISLVPGFVQYTSFT